jgi:hypothetical protein
MRKAAKCFKGELLLHITDRCHFGFWRGAVNASKNEIKVQHMQGRDLGRPGIRRGEKLRAGRWVNFNGKW